MRDTNIILTKVEGTYGTDAAPVVGTDAQLVYDWQPKPMQYDDLRRNIERNMAGATPKAKARGRQAHSFKFELCGSGTADVAAPWAIFTRACGFLAPSVSAGTEVAYPLVTADDGVGVTFWGYKQNLRHRTQGFRGNLKLNWTAGQLPYGEVDGMGLLNNLPDASSPSAPTLPSLLPGPVEVNSTNTAFSLDSYSALLRSFEIDLGMKVEYRDLVGQRAIIFGKSEDGERRAAKGRFTIELPDPGTKEYFAAVPARTALACTLTHGPATNQVEFATTKLYLDEPEFSVEQNRIMMTSSFELVPSAAGNEFTLKTR